MLNRPETAEFDVEYWCHKARILKREIRRNTTLNKKLKTINYKLRSWLSAADLELWQCAHRWLWALIDLPAIPVLFTFASVFYYTYIMQLILCSSIVNL
jgi:hypothetical protein